MALTIERSLDAKLYRGVAGSTASIECTTCRDVTAKFTVATSDISSRVSSFKLYQTALKDVSFDVEFVADTADPHFAAFLNAATTGGQIAVYAKDGTGGKGLDADMVVTEMDDTQKLEDAVIYKFTLKCTYLGYGQVGARPRWL